MAVNIPGIISVVVFYIAILALGIIVGRKTSKSKTNEAVLVADRSLGFIVSLFTITATNVGGGYIIGTAESAAWHGVLQTVAPVGYFFSFILSGLFFAPKLRRENYITMFDPFQLKYGKKVGALLFIPQMLGDLFWSAAILAGLGATLSVILDINSILAIVVSAAVAMAYTLMGGLYSVAYTDVLQLLFIVVGMFIAFPFTLTHPAVDLSRVADTWLGEIPPRTTGASIDVLLLCTFGGIPWQAIYQRVLACRTVRIALIATVLSGFFSFFLAIPSYMMGFAGAAADWNATSYDGPIPIPEDMRSYILPLSLSYLVPTPVSIIGIGAIAAAVMSSSDSVILSSSSVITKNIYHDIIRPKASQRELTWAMRITILIVGTLGTLVAILSTTIYGLYVMCADLMYVVLFPQLTLVLWMPKSNAYGSIIGFTVSLTLRLLSGEPVLNLPAVIKYPYFDEKNHVQLFPFRTFAMLLGALCIVVFSLLTHLLFVKEVIPRKYDFLHCYRQKTIKMRYDESDYIDEDEKDQTLALKD